MNTMGRIARALIVDDSSTNQVLTQCLLSALGYEVVTARSGEEALDILEKREFDVILLDIYLPGMSGVELATMIRGMEVGDNPSTIIAMSATPLTELDIPVSREAFGHYLEKPLSYHSLKNVIGESASFTGDDAQPPAFSSEETRETAFS